MSSSNDSKLGSLLLVSLKKKKVLNPKYSIYNQKANIERHIKKKTKLKTEKTRRRSKVAILSSVGGEEVYQARSQGLYTPHRKKEWRGDLEEEEDEWNWK